MVTIFKEKLKEKDAPENVIENVTETRYALILDLIKLNKRITVEQPEDIFNINRRTIIRDNEKLREESRIKRIGAAKGDRWKNIQKITGHNSNEK